MIDKLKTEFSGRGSVKGFDFKQILNSNGFYIYEKSIDGDVISYEVFKETIGKARPGFGKPNDYIKYPSDESFGVWAWEAHSYDRALKIIVDEKNRA